MMTPVRAILFNAAGVAWAEVNQLPELIGDMLAASDLGWVRDVARFTGSGEASSLADFGPYSLDPETREILLSSRVEPT